MRMPAPPIRALPTCIEINQAAATRPTREVMVDLGLGNDDDEFYGMDTLKLRPQPARPLCRRPRRAAEPGHRHDAGAGR